MADTVSKRQVEIKQLSDSGLSREDIASRLNISPRTVYRELNVVNSVIEDSEVVQRARVDVINLSDKAVDRYRTSLDTKDRDSFAVATNVLKTVGALRERVEIEHNHQVHTAEEFNDRFTNALRLAGQRPEEAEVVEDSDE